MYTCSLIVEVRVTIYLGPLNVLQPQIIKETFVVQWLPSEEMDTATRIRILDEIGWILHTANINWRDMYPFTLPLVMGK